MWSILLSQRSSAHLKGDLKLADTLISSFPKGPCRCMVCYIAGPYRVAYILTLGSMYNMNGSWNLWDLWEQAQHFELGETDCNRHLRSNMDQIAREIVGNYFAARGVTLIGDTYVPFCFGPPKLATNSPVSHN